MKQPLRLLVACLAGFSPLSQAADGDVLARMGALSLTVADVRQLAEANPDQAKTPQGLGRLIRNELLARTLADEARRQGMDKKSDVAARMARAADLALASAYMNGIARPPTDFPSDDQLRLAYETAKPGLLTPRRYRISQIYLEGGDDRTRKAMDDLAREAQRKGADFAALARKHSRHAASAAQGGDVGWLNESELAPEVRDAVKTMDKGEVGKPLKSGNGWRLLKLTGLDEPQTLPFDQVRDNLARNLKLRKAAEIEAAYLQKLEARTPIAINGIALEELRKP
ncbi:MAG: peptidylprolyl isomerase [Pseudomonadota bacterium]